MINAVLSSLLVIRLVLDVTQQCDFGGLSTSPDQIKKIAPELVQLLLGCDDLSTMTSDDSSSPPCEQSGRLTWLVCMLLSRPIRIFVPHCGDDPVY